MHSCIPTHGYNPTAYYTVKTIAIIKSIICSIQTRLFSLLSELLLLMSNTNTPLSFELIMSTHLTTQYFKEQLRFILMLHKNRFHIRSLKPLHL